jgi:hypothetical protein
MDQRVEEHEQQNPEPSDRAVESALTASRPAPDAGFVAALEQRLFPHARGHPRVSRRPALVGAAAAGALATAALGLSLAGVGPLSGGGNGVRAGSDCHFVTVSKRETVPVIARGHGHSELQFRRQTVERRVKRCS